MPVMMQDGETLESKHKVSTKFGKGVLYVTNRALLIEVKKKGIIFHRFHRQMAGIEARAIRTIRVKWPEGSQIHEFDFKAWGARDIVKQIDGKHRYAQNYANDGGGRVLFDDSQRMQIRDARVKWAVNMLKKQEKKQKKADREYQKQKITESEYQEICKDTESWRWTAICARGIACSRLHGVPELVEDHLVWHDAWCEGNYFYTFNSLHVRNGKALEGETDEKTGAYRVPMSHVGFRHGYPYIKVEHMEGSITKVGTLIPSMTDEMLDDELIAMRWAPRHRNENGLGQHDIPSSVVFSYVSDFLAMNNQIPITKRESHYIYKMIKLDDYILKHYGLPLKFDEAEAGRLAALEKY